MDRELPRRAAKKAATRAAMADAGLRLFAKRGFDDVTAEEIAAAAGVSLSTFFRYFATKESVILFGEFNFITVLTAAYLQVPAERSDRDAMLEALLAVTPSITPQHRRARLHYTAVGSSAVLLGHQQIHHHASASRLAEAIASRRGAEAVDAASSLFATISLAILEHAITEWAAGPARVPLAAMIDQRFAALSDALIGATTS
jgi:AcrR family transcriptional regulator